MRLGLQAEGDDEEERVGRGKLDVASLEASEGERLKRDVK